jgi:DNA-binding Lrp family transcriptional regulator
MSAAGPSRRGPARYGSMPLRFADGSAPGAVHNTHLDAADLRIIDSLAADGRAKVRSMTASIGLSEETIADRMRALIDRNLIGITAILDWRAAGYQWDLFLSVRAGSAGAQAVIDELALRDEVVSIYEVFGPIDIVAHVLCRDRATMLEFISTSVPRVGGLGTANVMLALDTVKFFHQFANVPVTGPPPALPDPIIELSAVDHGIIGALMRNGRAAYREVARELGVADGTIRTRFRRLVSSGLLRICAQVHPSNSGMIGAQAFVGISSPRADHAALATRLAKVDEILTIAVTTGRFDLFCFVAARSRAELIDLIATQIRLIDGVRAVETWEVTAVRKHEARWARW